MMINSLESSLPWAASFFNLAKRLGIDCISKTDPRYENARQVYNRFHNLYPTALIRTQNAQAISEIVRFCSDNSVVIALRGGGHHIAGFGSCNDGIVIDFSPFRRVVLDKSKGMAQVEAGTRLCDLDQATTECSQVVPVGTVSETGVTGLTLGGGIGWLVGSYGLTCDHLIGADIVLADGRIVQAEDPSHADLLWALRGGGGNFGVITKLRYNLRPIPYCITGSAIVPLSSAAPILERLINFLEHRCPRHLTVAPTFTHAWNKVSILSIDFCIAANDRRTLETLHQVIGAAEWSIQHNSSFVKWQSSFDSLFQPPMRGYWKARYSKNITKSDIDVLIDMFSNHPIQRTTILIEHLHGAFTDTGINESSFPLRWARYGILISARWLNIADDEVAVSWVQKSFNRLDPNDSSATYSNYTTADDKRAIQTLYKGDHQCRLVKVKREYDRFNLFSRNHNIQ